MKVAFCDLKRSRIVAVALFALILIPRVGGSAEWPLERPGLVSAGWLAEHLDRPDLRVIDARAALCAYVPEHIPGAVYPRSLIMRILVDKFLLAGA